MTAVGVVAVLGAIIAIAVSVSSSSAPPKKAGTTTKGGVRLWSHEVTMDLNQQYGLNSYPDKAGSCLYCIQVSPIWHYGNAALSADRGFERWTAKGVPTYANCVSSGIQSGVSLPAASLYVPHINTGAKPGTWFCALSDSEDMLRMRYDGANAAGTQFRFDVTAWTG